MLQKPWTSFFQTFNPWLFISVSKIDQDFKRIAIRTEGKSVLALTNIRLAGFLLKDFT
jgi:hypothetical protein